MGDFDNRRVADVLREMENAPPDAKTIVVVATKVLGPVIANYVKELRAENAELKRRVGDLESKLKLATLVKSLHDVGRWQDRLRTIEARLDAIASRGPRRVA